MRKVKVGKISFSAEMTSLVVEANLIMEEEISFQKLMLIIFFKILRMNVYEGYS